MNKQIKLRFFSLVLIGLGLIAGFSSCKIENVKVPNKCVVNITTLDKDTFQPVKGTEITSYPIMGRNETSENGEMTITLDFSGDYMLRYYKEGYQVDSVKIRFTSGERSEYKILLEKNISSTFSENIRIKQNKYI